MLGPFPTEILGTIPSEIPIAIPHDMSSSILRTMLDIIPSENSCYFPSTNFGANLGTLSDVMLDIF